MNFKVIFFQKFQPKMFQNFGSKISNQNQLILIIFDYELSVNEKVISE